jgi:polysaccharide deacetylase 2 family uncharacterized protein YibQ
MMNKYKQYKLALWILAVIVVAQGIFIFYFSRPKRIPRPPAVAIKGKIAIVLDDWGYNLNNVALAQEIDYPLNISVLPNLPYSRTVAESFHRRGFELILHLPLEPRENLRLEKDTIMASQSEEEIKNILARDLKNVPYVRGVSNHMGSRATQDQRVMEVILRELKSRRLYFLDSFVAQGSVCPGLAQKLRIGFARRDVFLDNSSDTKYIKAQLLKLKSRCRLYGYAVGIGHDRRNTIAVLAEEMPRLAKEGYKFVFVSELVK